MILTWLHVGLLVFLAAGLVFAGGALLVPLVLAPKSKGGELDVPYECGMPPHGSARTRFGINYFIYALLFLAFDVDVLYLFPVATAYPGTPGLAAFWKVLVFLAVLGLALLYFWRKGVFTWPRRIL